MAIVYAEIRLSNAARPDIEEITVTALVDSGAIDLVIPEHVAERLQLTDLRPRELRIADGSIHKVRYVGPIKIETQGRDCLTAACVLGNQVLLGAIPMEAMDVIVHPRRQELIPNPEHPDVAGGIVMAA